MSISNDIVSTKIYDKRDDFDIQIVNSGNFLNEAVGILNSTKSFLNFIEDTMVRYLNSKLDLNLSCAKDIRNLRIVVTSCIN